MGRSYSKAPRVGWFGSENDIGVVFKLLLEVDSMLREGIESDEGLSIGIMNSLSTKGLGFGSLIRSLIERRHTERREKERTRTHELYKRS